MRTARLEAALNARAGPPHDGGDPLCTSAARSATTNLEAFSNGSESVTTETVRRRAGAEPILQRAAACEHNKSGTGARQKDGDSTTRLPSM